MILKYFLPVLAVAGLVFAINRVVEARRPGPTAEPIVEPPTRPVSVKMIAGSGLVEARRENIPIGVNIPGVVTEVFVKKGEKVSAGAPLFKTDDREFKSMLAVRDAELASSKAQLHKLIASPRPEDIPPAKAAAQEAEARMADAEAALARTERLFQRQMIAASDYDKDRYAYYAAKATYAKAKADLEKILAGSWK
jgi:HlyD family secretion protein